MNKPHIAVIGCREQLCVGMHGICIRTEKFSGAGFLISFHMEADGQI